MVVSEQATEAALQPDKTLISTAALLYPKMGSGAPYYIVAPPYTQDSAGVKMLYVLCHLLNLSGARAFIHVVPYFRSAADLGPGLVTPALTPATVELHRVAGETPIIVLPETMHINPFTGGIVVRWVMNFTGLLGGPNAFPEHEHIFAYSEVIARTIPNCAGKLFLPGSDPQFFKPPEGNQQRSGICYYAGKYVEVHEQEVPAHIVKEGTKITRGPNGQSREALRDIFQTHEVLHIFENTALATEALLCGCVVVANRNPYFVAMIAEAEHGSAGLYWDDQADSLALAQERIKQFRADYTACEQSALKGVVEFFDCTQQLALKSKTTVRLSINRRVNLVVVFDYFVYVQRQILRSTIEQGFFRTFGSVFSSLLRKFTKKEKL